MNPEDKTPFTHSSSSSSFPTSGQSEPPLPPLSVTTPFSSEMDPGFSVLFPDPTLATHPSFLDLGSFPGPVSQLEYGAVSAAEGFSVPQPLGCLQETPVPPFLSKTFDLVDDPSLDPIISWGPGGQSFVVWDPVDFARVILPRNFKHNNFSSFVRQLNTYGFRKIDADRWEFANEGFLRGKRHLLKNIQRRKSPGSQHPGSSSGASSSVEGEIEKLRKEKRVMMQEVIELQQQHRGTVEHMEAVNQKLQAAEQRQKQMVSFLAKVFQNPRVLARLQQMKEQRALTSPRTMKKFVKHQPHNNPPMEGQIVKYQPDLQETGMPTTLGSENIPFSDDPIFKGKNIQGSAPETMMNIPELASAELELESILVKEEGVWSMGFEGTSEMPSCSHELWGNLGTEFGVSSAISDVWDIDPLQAATSSGIEQWLGDDSPLDQPEPRDDSSKNLDP